MKSLDNMCSAGTKYAYLHNIGLTVDCHKNPKKHDNCSPYTQTDCLVTHILLRDWAEHP